MTPTKAEEALYKDLLSIYARAGAEVTYETDTGSVKPYWAKRFLQAVKRSEKKGELFEFVDRLLRADKPSRGFLILKKAGRLDLTVEALVSDRSKPYYGEIDFAVIEAARRRLANYGYDGAFDAAPAKAADAAETGVEPEPANEIRLLPGVSFDVRITVGDSGELLLSAI